MIRVERDPAFWLSVAQHPLVNHVLLGAGVDFSVVSDPRVHPIASAHGGYIFVQVDTFGQVFELHSLFTPQGWGREAYETAVSALGALPGWQLITTYQTEHRQSKPPVSFGFKSCGASYETDYGIWQSWFLTRNDWQASPVFRRMEARKCPLQS